MEVNDELGREWFRYTAKLGGKLTKATLGAILNGVVEGIKSGTLNKHGKMPLKNLVGQGQEVNQISLDKEVFENVSKFLKKNHIDFAVGELKDGSLPLFFKARDVSLIQHVLEKYLESEVSLDQEKSTELDKKTNSRKKSIKHDKEPIEEKIERAKDKAANQTLEPVKKTKDLSREAVR